MIYFTNVSLQFLYYEGIVLGILPVKFCLKRKVFIKNHRISVWSTISYLFSIFITLVSKILAAQTFIPLLDGDFLLSLLGLVNQVLFSLHIIANLSQIITKRKLILKIWNEANYRFIHGKSITKRLKKEYY